MDKPENYAYYVNSRNKIPYKDWPQDVKDYKNAQRRIRMNPKWKDLSEEDRKKERLKVIAQNRSKWHDKWNSMSDLDKSKINKKKGRFWSEASEDRKKEIRSRLSNISNDFWNSMNDTERKQFGEYRWNLKSDEEKNEIIQRFTEGGNKYMKSLSHDEIMSQIDKMNAARKEKFDSDEFFRNQQIKLLREHAMNYIDTLTTDDRRLLLKDNKLNQRFENQFIHSILIDQFYFTKEFIVKINDSIKFWDYAIYNRNSDLVMVVDLDGSFYHGDSSDYNGLHSSEERDERRGYFTPKNIKVCIIQDKYFLKGFEEMVRSLMLDYDKFIDDLFKRYRAMPFPEPRYESQDLYKSFQQLIQLNTESKYLKVSTRNREGDRIIQHFHPSIYHASVGKNPSPYDAWHNDDLLRKVICNRTLFRNVIDKNKILQGFNVCKIAPKVSVFSAGRAKILINKYLSEFDEVFDPFSGFSGRMLGTISLGKRYIGQDISELHIRESNNILEFLKDSMIEFEAVVDQINILQSSGEYQCLFTCPPYGNKEKWFDIPSDSRSCDDWINECLKRFKCQRYLFVVDHTKKFKDYIVDEINNKSHFGSNSEYIIMIDKGP